MPPRNGCNREIKNDENRRGKESKRSVMCGVTRGDAKLFPFKSDSFIFRESLIIIDVIIIMQREISIFHFLKLSTIKLCCVLLLICLLFSILMTNFTL